MATKKLRPTYAFKHRLEFLSAGKLYLKDSLKIISISYKTNETAGRGLRQFISEKLPPVQYRNPNVQIVLFKNEYHCKFPAMKLYFNDGKSVLLDLFGKRCERIMKELTDVAGKTDEQVQKAAKAAEYNPANFGDAWRGRLCMCEVPGQIPCPAKVPIKKPDHAWHKKSESS